MQLIATAIADVKVVEPRVFGDSRGYFFESFNQRQFDDALGERLTFVQDNQSRSARGVLRGLHYQVKQPQGKLIRVLQGEIFDVALDLRKGAPTFGKWVSEVLRAEDHRQLWIPAGFAHGFVVTSESAEVLYKTTDYWAPQYERCIRWDDPTLAIPWPLDGITPIVSDKDKLGMLFADYRHED
ncbi:dTDP-4-dehydrorhamnose 3,5-epimerase [Pandoraea pulmonicola]|uniref:dTDP-4-dehydrorhamnose 3,5-epimerase n=1 Tax=Pandoraea pulmonicola TaxID=93221 RepID=A0AAJ5D255_PANPU|nr:dTDP-4-dehydrorhamnose 3,5-epimerase [Pandoraea pulmonicola]AJC19664.1 dTDP-4-dehydrorhamnose 3,5-epimerase [Pandoraea pulmonicola]SUA92225.1 dTDP-4-dehydrorhamnose 3,5-epimerase [Pandoraea pulmonicola]